MPIRMVYSVGDSAADLKTGTPTVTVSGTTATFSTAQTGNIGVGDRVTYNTTDYAYIVGKTSTTVWTVRSVTGGTPTAGSGVTVNAINHAFTNGNDALTQFDNASHLNTANLVTADIQMDLAFYRDSADLSGEIFRASGTVTTDATRYVRLYAPFDTATECNNTQRHNGIWASQGVMIVHTSLRTIRCVDVRDIIVEGLQVDGNGALDGSSSLDILRNTSGGSATIRDCLIRRRCTGAVTQQAIVCGHGVVPLRIINTAIWLENTSTGTVHGINVGGGYEGTATAYNCTVHSVVGSGTINNVIRAAGTSTLVTTNVVSTGTGTCFSGTITQTYSCSADATASGTGSRTSQTVTYENSGAGDFRLTSGDAGARTFGTDLSADATYAFNQDFIRTTRGATWDMGAHQVTVGGGGATGAARYYYNRMMGV